MAVKWSIPSIYPGNCGIIPGQGLRTCTKHTQVPKTYIVDDLEVLPSDFRPGRSKRKKYKYDPGNQRDTQEYEYNTYKHHWGGPDPPQPTLSPAGPIKSAPQAQAPITWALNLGSVGAALEVPRPAWGLFHTAGSLLPRRVKTSLRGGHLRLMYLQLANLFIFPPLHPTLLRTLLSTSDSFLV